MRAHYSGDINIEHGGFFYCLQSVKWGYVDAVRVTPCSDAGGPDNLFWVESLSVNLDHKRKAECLACCGMEDTGNIHEWVYAAIAYGCYDVASTRNVQIGPDDPFCADHVRAEFRGFTRVRANSSLRRMAREQLRGDV